ncbi:MAG: PrpF domain-containing protein [Gammaproteobacteria bacterium]|nr:PrpF domain-containing protein [Gammaproteobacteria bacterium]
MSIPAVFMRGGTSNAVVFKRGDLPEDRALWDDIFLAALGSPDPNGRQLDGMGGGISSLSKICVVGPPSHPRADIDFTFAQVSVHAAQVDYGGNCGNMTSAMAPFAVDEGMVQVSGDAATVIIHNTNTDKLVRARFALDEGRAAVDGDLAIPGVAGTGAPVRLEFLSPGGASSGRLLPTGNVLDVLRVADIGDIDASLVDASNACVFVDAAALGLRGNEMPVALDADRELMDALERIRCAAGVAMGLGATVDEIRRERPSIPKLGLVAPPMSAVNLSGDALRETDGDLTARMISMGNTHRALPLTGALCLAVAARIDGTLPNRHARAASDARADLRIMQPSGTSVVGAGVERRDGEWIAHQASVYRTQRRLFEGRVMIPASRLGKGAVAALSRRVA